MGGKAQIVIAKHRKGATGTIILDFKAQYTKFQDPEEGTGKTGKPRNTFDGEVRDSKSNDFNNMPNQPFVENDPFGQGSINEHIPF